MTEKQFIKAYYKRQRTTENFGVRLFYHALIGQLNDVKQALLTIGDVQFVSPEKLVNQKRIEEAYTKFYLSQGLPYAQAMLEYINSQLDKKKEIVPIVTTGVGFNNESWLRLIKDFLYITSYQSIKNISDTTIKIVKNIFIDANNQGLNVRETANLLTEQGTKFAKNRALLIARTETTKLSNFAHVTAADSIVGVALQKKWIATYDLKTRDDHKSANGAIVAKDGLFSVGGQKMAYPGDGSHGAGADQICNCRCVVSYTVIR